MFFPSLVFSLTLHLADVAAALSAKPRMDMPQVASAANEAIVKEQIKNYE
jgi:hypothetical protein